MSVRRLSNSTISTQGRGKSSTFLAGYSPAIDEMDLIQRVVVGSGGTSSITFSNIPQTYQHLQIRGIVRGVRNFGGEQIYTRFNGDGGSNYSRHNLYGDGGAAIASGETNTTVIFYGEFPAALILSSAIMGAYIIDVLDYSSTNKNKTVRSIGGHDQNTDNSNLAGKVWLSSGLWRNTSSINTITILSNGDFSVNTTFSLYGVVG